MLSSQGGIKYLVICAHMHMHIRFKLAKKMISALNSWMGSVDKGKVVGALMIDMSKAFDTVPHQRLLGDLVDIGFSSDSC